MLWNHRNGARSRVPFGHIHTYKYLRTFSPPMSIWEIIGDATEATPTPPANFFNTWTSSRESSRNISHRDSLLRCIASSQGQTLADKTHFYYRLPPRSIDPHWKPTHLPASPTWIPSFPSAGSPIHLAGGAAVAATLQAIHRATLRRSHCASGAASPQQPYTYTQTSAPPIRHLPSSLSWRGAYQLFQRMGGRRGKARFFL